MMQRLTHLHWPPARHQPGTISCKPCPENFNRTLLKKFSSPPKPLLKTREQINQTLLEIFSADPA
jgi:hypothetical protein